jgi:hypothetical protein
MLKFHKIVVNILKIYFKFSSDQIAKENSSLDILTHIDKTGWNFFIRIEFRIGQVAQASMRP